MILLIKLYPDDNRIKTKAYHNYYKKNIGFVEILRNGIIEQHYFVIPKKCKLLTNKSRRKLISQGSKKATHHENNEEFVDKSEIWRIEMEW